MNSMIVEMIKRTWLARVEIAMRCWSGWARKEEQVNDANGKIVH